MLLKSGLYRHYKGKSYFVFQVASHSETEEPYVVYRYLYDDYGWSVRPLDLFLQTVELAGETIPRFRFERALTEQELANYLAPLVEVKNS
jgi:hypothetical protein